MKSGMLQCFQCQARHSVFEWLALTKGLDGWMAAANEAAGRYSIEIRKPSQTRVSKSQLTEEHVQHAEQQLRDSEDASGLRDVLAERGFTIGDLEPFSVGFRTGKHTGLCFFQRSEKGALAQKYRQWNPASAHRWSWHGEGPPRQFLWPQWIQPEGPEPIILCEGEWDTLTMRLLGYDNAYTWTGGAGGILIPDLLPQWLRGRAVRIVYDLDVFQGPDQSQWVAPSPKHMLDMKRRFAAMLRNTIAPLQQIGCSVEVGMVPRIDPRENFHGDLRDWAKAGGTNPEEIEYWPAESLTLARGSVATIDWPDVFESHEGLVKTVMRVSSTMRDGAPLPTAMTIDCAMGSIKACSECRAPQISNKGVIDIQSHMEDVYVSMTMPIPSNYLLRNMIGKPSGCSRAVLRTIRHEASTVWIGGSSSTEIDDREVVVISRERVRPGALVEVTGTLYQSATATILAAEEVAPVVRCAATVPNLQDAIALAPKSWDLVSVQKFFDDRYEDLAANVSKIYARPEIHLAFDLVAHSSLWMIYNDTRRRAWLDAAVVGETRTGKSEVAISLSNHYGPAIERASSQGNWSTTGLTMGAARDRTNQLKVRPGLLPRNNGGMIVLDEFQVMYRLKGTAQLLMESLQESRDKGVVQAVKTYGHYKLEAAVRMLTIANPTDSENGTFSDRFPVEEIAEMYGSPESIARLDYSLAVFFTEHIPEPTTVPNRWTSSLCRAVLDRAWAIQPEDIVIEPEARLKADSAVTAWSDESFSKQVPMFRPADFALTVLRIAIAAANLTMSHPKGALAKCLVRPVHVEFAIQWIEVCWQTIGYRRYSMRDEALATLTRPNYVEWTLIKSFREPQQAIASLSRMSRPMTRETCLALFGADSREWTTFLSRGISNRLFTMDKPRGGGPDQIVLTSAARAMVQTILRIAGDYPGAYTKRWAALSAFYANRLFSESGHSADHSLIVPATTSWDLLEGSLAAAEEEAQAEGRMIGGPW